MLHPGLVYTTENSLSHSSEDWKAKVKAATELVSGEVVLPEL